MSEATVADKRLHPGTIALRWLAEAPQTVIGLPALTAFVSDLGIGIALLVMLGLGVVSLLFAYLRWTRFRYGIGAQEVVIESGIIARNRRTIPFARVQDVDIERKLLHRIFGLAKVRIESGGGGKDEGSLDSVSRAEADRIRAALRAAKGGAAKVQEETPQSDDASAPEDALFAMPLRRVLKYGLFSYSFSSLAAILGGLGYLYSQLDDVFGDPAVLYKQAEGYAVETRFDPLWILWGALILLLLAMVTSVGKALLTEFGFRLTRDDRGLRRARGLLTRTEALIPKKRVQLGLVTTGLIWSRIGHEALALQTLGAGDGASGHQVAAPFATRAELIPIVAEVPPLRFPDEAAFRSVSPRHRWLVIVEFPFILAAGLVAGWFFWWVWLFSIPLLFVMAGQWINATRHEYAVDNDLLFVRSGFWRRKLWLVPIGHAEAVSIRQGWLQRKWALASVLVDTAGATHFSDPRIVDLDVGVAKALAADLIAIARRERGLGHADQRRRIPPSSNT